MVNLDGIQYFATVPIGLVVGLVLSLIIALAFGPTWWIVAPPIVGCWLGVKAGKWMK